MAERTKPQNKKRIVMATFAFLFGLYRLGTPYLEETDDMRKEAEKIAKQIEEIKDESAQYGKGWQERMDKIEKDVKARLPDQLEAGAVLEYFLANFEKDHPGGAVFLSVGTQPVTTMFMKPGKEQEKEPPRIQRYKFEARLAQEMVVPFIEHCEHYPGLFMITDFAFHLETGVQGLKEEMGFIFFLSPKEWITDTKVALSDDDDDDDDLSQPKGWTQIFLPPPEIKGPGSREPAKMQPTAHHYREKKAPMPDRLVGSSVVIDETLYEEGDRIGSWVIEHVDSANHRVTFKSGKTIKTVSVK